jgi:3',5'-cyclic AMP phosphodiesterase CpdA
MVFGRLWLIALPGLVASALAACAAPKSVGPASDREPWPDAVTIVAAGDIADCRLVTPGSSGAAQTAALVAATDTAVLTVGDNTYPVGAPAEFTDCFDPTWGRFGARLRPSPGNHDYQTPGAAGYYAYFGDRAGPVRRGYYSFDLAGWHIISLNSAVDAKAGSPQYRWLVDDLAASSAALCSMVVWHHPVYSSGPHGNDPRMRDALAALHAAGSDIVLAGHDHVYERLEPHDAAGESDPRRGIRSFTVGTGGARLYQFKTLHPRSEVRDATTHGVLRLTLGSGKYRWEFMPVGGGPARDRGEGKCHR